jgi:long-subunit acyl-CoA synthetase (AMP-forming)
LYSCSCTVPRIWESIYSTIIHDLMISPAIHVFLQPVTGWSYLVSGIGRHSRRTERQVPICRLIWVGCWTGWPLLFCRGG